MDDIEALGCKLPSPLIECRKCEQDIQGGFVPNINNEKDYKPKVRMLLCMLVVEADTSSCCCVLLCRLSCARTTS